MNRVRIVRATLVSIGLVAFCATAGVLGWRYYRYRARYVATHSAIHNVSWGEGDPTMEIDYEKCWRPRFGDISFFSTDSIMCGGYYSRHPWGIHVSLKAFVREVDFDCLRIAAPSAGTADFFLFRDGVIFQQYKGVFILEISFVFRQDAIPARLDSIAPLQVAFIRDGEVMGDYAELYFLGDLRSEYTPGRVAQTTRMILGRAAPLRVFTLEWRGGLPANDGREVPGSPAAIEKDSDAPTPEKDD